MRGLRDAIMRRTVRGPCGGARSRWRAGDTPPDDPAAESLAEDREAVPS